MSARRRRCASIGSPACGLRWSASSMPRWCGMATGLPAGWGQAVLLPRRSPKRNTSFEQTSMQRPQLVQLGDMETEGLREGAGGDDPLTGQGLARRHDPLAHRFLEEPPQHIGLVEQLRFRDEGPAALEAGDQAATLQASEGLAEGHAADPQLVGQLALARQAFSGGEGSLLDLAGQLLLDLEVGRQAARRWAQRTARL